MPFDYDKVAHRYDNYRGGGGPYLRRLLQLADARAARRVLELGAGTGNNTIAFLDAYPADLIALEPSRGMIGKAVAKGVPGTWLRGSASDIPLASCSTDLVFAVYVLHHIEELEPVLAECARVLCNGPVAFVTATIDFIESHPMNRYFPSFAKVDKARFQPVAEIKEALENAGFTQTGEERFLAQPQPIGRQYADRVANKFISTYELIPDDEFESGLERLYADLEGKDSLDANIQWESAVVWGWAHSD